MLLLLLISSVLLKRIVLSGRWVEAMETLPSLVVPGLVHLIAKGQTGKYSWQEYSFVIRQKFALLEFDKHVYYSLFTALIF